MDHQEVHNLLKILHMAGPAANMPQIVAAARKRLREIEAELMPAPPAPAAPAWVDESTKPRAVREIVDGLPGPAEAAPEAPTTERRI